MNLQTVFYTVGIIYMVLAIIIMVSIAVLIFYVRKKIGDLQDLVEVRINELTRISLKPLKKATEITRTLFPASTKTAKRTK